MHRTKIIAWLFVLLPLACPPAQAQDKTLEAVISDAISATVSFLKTNGLSITPESASQAALESLVKLADPGARFISATDLEHLRQEEQGLDYQLGIRITMTNGTPHIIDIVTNSPAATAELQSGDQLLSVGETGLTGKTIAEANRLLRGHAEITNVLQYSRSSETNETQISFQLLQLPTVEIAEEWPFQLAYVKINGLYKNSGREIINLLRKWSETGRFGVILDLRNANGDNITSAGEIGSLFTETGSLLCAFRNAEDQDLDVYKAEAGSSLNMPVMVLIDENTQGAAEVLAAIFKGSVRGAMIIGHPTKANPLIRTILELPNKDLLYMATKRLVTADGTIYKGIEGVQPDIRMNAHIDTTDYEPETTPIGRTILEEEIADKALRLRTHSDPALRRAMDILLGLKALNIRGIVTPTTSP